MKIVIDTKYNDTFTATSKAREDANKILIKNGFKVNYIIIKSKNLLLNVFFNYIQLKKILKKIPKKSTLLFQYPFDSMSYRFSKTIKKYCIKNNINSIALIHDINLLRTTSKMGKFYFKYFIKEFKFLNNFDEIICHNSRMKNYLVSNNVEKNKIICLNLFDYLINDSSKKSDKDNFKCVIVAGNLSKNKAGYLYKLIDTNIAGYKYNLYGMNYQGDETENIIYKGVFKSDKPREKINNGFGLVWDGNSYDGCDGNFGEYLKWNNPHKFSLYMAIGIPVIVWSESALSEFVKANEIGVVIDSLCDLNTFFEKLDYAQYKKYVNNVKKIQKKVINGEFLNQVIKEFKI